LARQDFTVDVFDRAPALEEFGARLRLAPNATRALGARRPLDCYARLYAA